MIDLNNIKELETYFSENLTTPLFPILSDLYFQNGDYSRAKKVCDIGLSNHPNSSIGYYILGKIELINNNLIKAEKFLEKAILYGDINLSSMILLFLIQKELKRNQIKIKKNVENILLIDPKNIDCNDWINKNFKKEENLIHTEKQEESIKSKDKKTTISKKSIIDKSKNISKEINKKVQKENIDINKELASMTLFNIYKSQGYYDQALQVLEVLKEKDKKNKLIKEEVEILNNLISEEK